MKKYFKSNIMTGRAAGLALAAVVGAGALLTAVPEGAVAENRAERQNSTLEYSARVEAPDISSISGLYFHLDALEETANDGDKISVMQNAGSGGNAVQTDETRRPQFVESGKINGYPAYRFTANSFLTIENSENKFVENMTVYMVANASSLPEHGEIFSRVSGSPFDHNWFFNIERGKLNYGWCVRGDNGGLSYPQSNIELNENVPMIVGARKDGSRAAMYHNGVTAAEFMGAPIPADHAGTAITLGGADDSFIGDIGELLFFDRALTDSENMLVERYLEARWDMTNLHDGMLTGISVGGTALGEFRPNKTDYVYLADKKPEIKDITCSAWNDGDDIKIAESADGFTIEVTSKVTGKKTTYTLGIKMRNYEFNEIEKFTANEVKLNDGFWSGLYKQYSVHTVNFMFDMFDMSKSFDNFDRVAAGERKTLGNTSEYAAKVMKPKDDRNVYNTTWEWIEEPWREGLIYEGIRAASEFIIVNRSNPEYKKDVEDLVERLDGYIDRIYAATLKTTGKDGKGKPVDGYFSTYNILAQNYVVDEAESSGRWHHDIYNFGCLAEAAVYHYNATGDTRLLYAATRFTEFLIDYIDGRDGYKGYKVVPPHELPEEALQRLYDLYNEHPELVKLMEDRYTHADGLSNKDRYYTLEIRLPKYKEIAASWITDRGNSEGRYNTTNYGAYAQDNVTYDKLTDATGHAVRANLWYNGIAYIGNRQENDEFVAAAERVWQNIVGSQMYITGGTGSTHDGDEAYGGSNELPHNGYCETCASVGMAFFGQNMFYLFGNAEYADTVELEMYNGILGCLGLDGNSFYYTNPMISDNYTRPMFSNATPCCVPMFLKFFSELPEIIYAKTDDTLFVNQYVSSSLQSAVGSNDVTVIQDTDMPSGNRASFSVKGSAKLKLRMPSWASGATLTVNGKAVEAKADADGYIGVNVTGSADIRIVFEKNVLRVTQDNAKANENKVAFRYGSFIYCAEIEDNADLKSDFAVGENCVTEIVINDSDFAYRMSENEYVDIAVNTIKITGIENKNGALTLIPFYLRGNRGGGFMKVWFDRT